MTGFTAAAIQLGPASATIAETTDRIEMLMSRAAAHGAKLAVLPELALSPYFAAEIQDVSQWVEPAANLDALERIAARAADLSMAVVVSYAEHDSRGLYNSMAFYDAQGQRKGLFRKVHIPGTHKPDPAKSLNILEKHYFTPGDLGFPAHDLGMVRVGGLICYDRRFPESYRSLMLNGAELFCCGYNTPVLEGTTLDGARRASELAICGGAYSNGTWAIAAGKAGVENGHTYIGGSFICTPTGEIVAQCQSMEDEVIVAHVDMGLQASIRGRWAFDINRMEDAYTLSPPQPLSGAA
ncbi:nitrilase-related carbon-nitrogen hydrolase [Mesobacterium pallidum]|uniref:nitrilase-related carbon-nitrogen hydrolase n=1 Tax=Mesobacterium pallidum TaxID=2872037 RepID=UPI001EE268F9|nr:nitrilase-related carbon-nitrogen hydrolase [Mesobacterium pallidum]